MTAYCVLALVFFTALQLSALAALRQGRIAFSGDVPEHPLALFLDHEAGLHATPHPDCIHRDCHRAGPPDPSSSTSSSGDA